MLLYILCTTFCAALYTLYTDTNQRSKLVFKFLTSSWQEWERNLLIDDVVPYLQAFARRLGFEFRLAEMRWGIRADASSSHMTSEICMAELERCQRESQGFSYVFLGCVPHCFPSHSAWAAHAAWARGGCGLCCWRGGLCFVLMRLGCGSGGCMHGTDVVSTRAQKYGFRPFPAKIPQQVFERLRGACDGAGKALLDECFRLDSNVSLSASKPAPPSLTVCRPASSDLCVFCLSMHL